MIEILIVIGIIGILSAVALGAYTVSQQKGRNAVRKSNLAQIARALEVYANDFGRYPASSGGEIMGCGASGTDACSWGGTFATSGSLNQTYMKVLPNDPSRSARYFYSTSDRTDFMLCSTLEAPSSVDPAYRDGDIPECSDCGTECHYKLTEAGVEMP